MKGRQDAVFGWTIWVAAISVVSAVAIIRIVRVFDAGGPWDVVDLIYDDAYYYLTVAANTVADGRSTLDGVTATNGYQPMWFICVVILGFVVGTEPMRFFVAFVVMVCVIVIMSTLAGYPARNATSLVPQARPALAFGVAVAVVAMPEVFFLGMETVLLLPLVIPLVLFMERPADKSTLLVLSGLFGLAFLVRLDALALLAAYVLVVLIVIPISTRWFSPTRFSSACHLSVSSMLAWLSSIVGPVIAVYLATNLIFFGTPLPVSGLAKGIGPRFANFEVFLSYWKEFVALAAIMALWFAIEAFGLAVGLRSSAFLRSIAVVLIACSIQAIYYATASTWKLWDWYFYLIALATVLIVARSLVLCFELTKQERRMAGAALCVLLVLLLAVRPAAYQVKYWGTPQHSAPALADVGRDVDLSRQIYSYNEISLLMLRDFFAKSKQVPVTVAMGDRAGGLSYWGRGTVNVVHAEGLLLDVSYINARRAGSAEDYLSAYPGIDYYVVDRDYIPSVWSRESGRVYVVADPIQAMVTDENYSVSVFCFPASSIAYHVQYRRASGPTERVAFNFDGRIACSPDMRDIFREPIATGRLREYSLPNEYK